MSGTPLITGVITQELVTGVFAGLITAGLLPGFSSLIWGFLGYVLAFKRGTDLSGVYDCEYHMHWKPEGGNLIYERIFLFKFGNKYFGYLINNNSDNKYRSLAKPGFRLVGELFLHQYFIGRWADPMPNNNTCGAFNILIDQNGEVHGGQWNGKSATYNKIMEGRWIFKKTQEKYGLLKLLKHIISGN